MAPNLPSKSPRMTSPHLHHEHPVIPITQPRQEIIVDKHEEGGREVGGIEYHPLGKGKVSPMKDRVRINEGMGEGAGWKTGSVSDMTHSQSPRQAGDGGKRGYERHGNGEGGGRYMDQGLDLQRQPHRDTQEIGPSPLPLPAAMTASHHPSANHHHAQHPQPHVNTTGGPRLYIQPPTPDNPSPSPPPALQVRSLNTPNPVQGNNNPNLMNDGLGGKHERQGGINEEEGGRGGGGGMMSRFKTTFLSKNKGPMSKTWARKSYLDELESMAPTSPISPRPSTSPRNHRSAPVTPLGHGEGDFKSGQQGMRMITRDKRELPRAGSVYASPIALAQFKALPPMNPQGEAMVAPR